jgi:hypothetical protein
MIHFNVQVIRILESYPALLLSPLPTGVRVKQSKARAPLVSILQETPSIPQKIQIPTGEP